MGLFNEEYEKEKEEFSALNMKSARKNLRVLKQVGTSNALRDRERKALASGKRISKTGKVYWETRKNRSDAVGSRL